MIAPEAREPDPKKIDTLRFLAAEVIQRMEQRRAAQRTADTTD